MDEALHKQIAAGNLCDVEKLIKSGASINNLFGMKGTPLCAAIYADKPQIADKLIEHGCDVNSKDYDGEPPLCLAIRTGKHDMIERLLQEPLCDVNRMDPVTGCRPLHIAVRNGDYNTACALVRRDCVDLCNKNGQTAIDIGITAKKNDIVKMLVESGCSLLVMNNDGEIPLFVAIKMNEFDLMCLILDKMLEKDSAGQAVLDYQMPGIQTTPLMQAIAVENLDAAFELIRRGCDVNASNFCGETALYLACKYNHPDLACSLLEAKANPSAAATNKRSFSYSGKVFTKAPIHEAIHVGNLQLVKKLLEHGADLNAVDVNGNDALCCALYSNKSQIVDHILDFVSSKGMPLSRTFKSRNHPLVAVASCTSPAYFANRLAVVHEHVDNKMLSYKCYM